MRRHRARPEEQITAADPAFCQLLADIILARDVERRIQAGLVDHEHMPTVQ
jgi:hypothetical protein